MNSPSHATAFATDAVVTASAASDFVAAPELPDILPPVKVRRGLVGFLWRHPAIAIGGALVATIAIFLPAFLLVAASGPLEANRAG